MWFFSNFLEQILDKSPFLVPLFSGSLVILMLVFSTEIYVVIAVLGSTLFVFLLAVGDFFACFLIYELSVITVFSTFALEGSSASSFFAFAAMALMSAISMGLVFLILQLVFSMKAAKSSLVLLIFVVFSVKSPVFPFSFWLPEAHVEAAWPGSMGLAVFGLKFSLFSIFLVANSAVNENSEMIFILILSIFASSLGISSTSDQKKIVAQLSIFHMSSFLFLLKESGFLGVFSTANFNWHHHSVMTGGLFLVIGAIYGVFSSSLSSFGFFSYNFSAISCMVIFLLFSCSFDLPWTANSIVEIMIFKSTTVFSMTPFFLGFVVGFFAFVANVLKIYSASNFKLLFSTEIRSTVQFTVFLATLLASLGFFIF